MQLCTVALLARVVKVSGQAQAHHGCLFANVGHGISDSWNTRRQALATLRRVSVA